MYRQHARPWGNFENLLETERYKVKRITVFPGKRLSLQKHKHRAEYWTIVQGNGVVTLDGNDIEVVYNDFVKIDLGSVHRIKNTGEEDLVFIEIQTGEYFGEDDIERLEDDFGRS